MNSAETERVRAPARRSFFSNLSLVLRFIGSYYRTSIPLVFFARSVGGVVGGGAIRISPFQLFAGQRSIFTYARLVFSQRAIVWIASVSKSGNTWVRYLLHSALFAQPPGTSPEATVPHRRELFTALQRGTARYTERGGLLLVKTHTLPFDTEVGWTRYLMPLTAGAIYVYRNPKDVCLSQINHVRLVAAGEQRSDRELAFLFLQSQLFASEGPWLGHIEAWRDNGRFPVLMLRYEDIKRDTPHAVAEMLRFLGEAAPAAAIDDAVAASSFDAMRAIEERRGDGLGYTAHRDDQPAARFVNKGLSNQSLDHLGADFAEAFDRRFAEQMKSMGY